MSEPLSYSPFLTAPQSSPRAQNTDRARTRINARLAFPICAITAIAPVALASNRPIAWTIWAFVVGLIAVIYGFALAKARQAPRFGLGRLSVESALIASVLGYLVVQLLPIGQFEIPNPGGITLSVPQISIAPGATLLMLLRLTTYALFFFLVLQIGANPNRRRRILDVLLIIVLGHAFYSLLALFQFGDTILGVPKWGYPGSATGTFVNRNSFATFLAFGAAIASANLAASVSATLATASRRVLGNNAVLYLVALVLLLVTVVATNSRMGLLVFTVATAVPMVCLLAKTRLPRGVVWATLLAVLAVTVLVLVFYGASIIERTGQIEQSTELRSTLYAQVTNLIALRPWLGFGGGTFENAFYLVRQASLNVDHNWDRSHNSYLSLWSDLGLVFGSIPVLVFGMISFRIQSSMLRRDVAWTGQAAALGVLAAGAIHSLADFSLEIQANMFLFLVVVGLGLAATLTTREK